MNSDRPRRARPDRHDRRNTRGDHGDKPRRRLSRAHDARRPSSERRPLSSSPMCPARSALRNVASVGEDDFGKLNLDRLRRDGSTSRPSRSAPTSNRQRLRPLPEDGPRDFVYNIANSVPVWSVDDAAKALFARAGHSPYHGSPPSVLQPVVDVLEAGFAAIKARGGTISVDPSFRAKSFSIRGRRGRVSRGCSTPPIWCCPRATRSKLRPASEMKPRRSRRCSRAASTRW